MNCFIFLKHLKTKFRYPHIDAYSIGTNPFRMKDDISLQVNGQQHTFNIDPDTPLLYVLRNQLQLNGPKFGCGLQQCGSCMVLMDGEALPSCQIPASAVQDRDIVTLEGLSQNGQLHPVQEAIVEEQAAQCGYCLNGVIISAVALLDKNPKPDRAAIDQGMQRVLCRCSTHGRFLRAIRSAAEKM